ncbi:MAG: glycosyltransferase [Cyclobacteriaceae bacterium]|nr:glycosyltransferase [Cyclobacteriaceae bacterium]
MTNPLVSIITIVLNGEKGLQRAIQSVADQTYQNIEYIIVDGGSTDNTLNLINENSIHISKWVSEKDKGIADAFNKGLKLCKGDIVGFLNADDWYEPDAVASAVACMKECDIAYGDVQFWEHGKQKHRTTGDHKKLKNGMAIAHPAVFVKMEIYKRFGGFNINYKIAMDYEIMSRFYYGNVSFKNINKIITNMTLGGLSDKYWLKAFIEDRRVITIYRGVWWAYFTFIRKVLFFYLKRLLR